MLTYQGHHERGNQDGYHQQSELETRRVDNVHIFAHHLLLLTHWWLTFLLLFGRHVDEPNEGTIDEVRAFSPASLLRAAVQNGARPNEGKALQVRRELYIQERAKSVPIYRLLSLSAIVVLN